MKSLLQQLWLQSENCKHPIQNIAFQLMEVSKFTGKSRLEIWEYLQLLINQKCIEEISTEPKLIQFTVEESRIKSEEDIIRLIKNA